MTDQEKRIAEKLEKMTKELDERDKRMKEEQVASENRMIEAMKAMLAERDIAEKKLDEARTTTSLGGSKTTEDRDDEDKQSHADEDDVDEAEVTTHSTGFGARVGSRSTPTKPEPFNGTGIDRTSKYVAFKHQQQIFIDELIRGGEVLVREESVRSSSAICRAKPLSRLRSS